MERYRLRTNLSKPISNYFLDVSNQTGTLVACDKDGIRFRLDRNFPDLAEWDNELVWTSDDVDITSFSGADSSAFFCGYFESLVAEKLPSGPPSPKARAVIASLELLREGANALLLVYGDYKDDTMFNAEAGLDRVMPSSCDEWCLTINDVIEKLSQPAPDGDKSAYLDTVGTQCGLNAEFCVRAWHLGPDKHPWHTSGDYFILDQEDGTYSLVRRHVENADDPGDAEIDTILCSKSPAELVELATKVMR